MYCITSTSWIVYVHVIIRMGWGAYHRLLHWVPSNEGYLLLAGINCEASSGMGRIHVLYMWMKWAVYCYMNTVKIVCVFWIHLRLKGCEKSCGVFFNESWNLGTIHVWVYSGVTSAGDVIWQMDYYLLASMTLYLSGVWIKMT